MVTHHLSGCKCKSQSVEWKFPTPGHTVSCIRLTLLSSRISSAPLCRPPGCFFNSKLAEPRLLLAGHREACCTETPAHLHAAPDMPLVYFSIARRRLAGAVGSQRWCVRCYKNKSDILLLSKPWITAMHSMCNSTSGSKTIKK